MFNLINKEKLNNNKVYVIGKVTNKKPYRSGGVIYSFEYHYQGIKYLGQNTDVFWHKNLNELFYIKILLKDSAAIGDIDFVDSISVPYCLTMESVPKDGWKELPFDTCK